MVPKTRAVYFLIVLVLIAGGFFIAKRFLFHKKHNAIVILIDTLRADHLGVYGYKRDTSPNLDAFARENVRAERAISVAPWTPPSAASILTGLSVARHGYNPVQMESMSKKLGELLRDDIDTLPEILKAQGYKTAAASASPWVSREFNFSQGFDNFIHERRSGTDVILNAARHEVDQFSKDKSSPFFLYVHILDPHGPYTPGPKYANMFSGKVEGTWDYDDETQNTINKYDEEIRSVDDQLGDFFSYLKQNGLYDNTAIIIVSDHGEQFREHGEAGHGKMLHIEEVHVPLLVKCKGENKVIDSVVSNLDVTPTMIDCLDIKTKNIFDGISVIDENKVRNRTGTYSSVRRAYVQEAFTTKDGMRIINSKGRTKAQSKDWQVEGTYNLDTDPFEMKPGFEPGLVSELNGYLNSTKNALTPAKKVKNKSRAVTKESMEQLESLGYINN